MTDLITELRSKIIQTLNLTDITPEDIDADEPLIGGSLGIDSIDILELVIMMEKEYGITIDNRELGAQVFTSLKTMADHIKRTSPTT
jgi:acyl carrier protein